MQQCSAAIISQYSSQVAIKESVPTDMTSIQYLPVMTS